MVEIRPFRVGDEEAVGLLHRRVWQPESADSSQESERYASWLRDTFLRHPWGESGIHSLVAESGERVIGFMGVLPRPLRLGSQSLFAAVSSQLVVSPDERASLAGLSLIKAFFAGPQDVSIADEANTPARRIWEAAGGSTASITSVGWTTLLRPVQYGLSRASKRPGLGWMRHTGLLASVADSMVSKRWLQSSKRMALGTTLMTEGGDDDLLSWFEDRRSADVGRTDPLKPRYDETSLRWLMDRLRSSGQAVRIGIVRDRKETPVGCFVYREEKSQDAEVLLLQSSSRLADQTFAWLVRDAADRNISSLSGRMQPDFVEPISYARSVLRSPPRWTLFHTGLDIVASQFREGRTQLSRLEGEFPSRLS